MLEDHLHGDGFGICHDLSRGLVKDVMLCSLRFKDLGINPQWDSLNGRSTH